MEKSFISKGKKNVPHICTSVHPKHTPSHGIMRSTCAQEEMWGGTSFVGYLPTCRWHEFFTWKCSLTITRRMTSIQIQAANW